MEESKGEMLLGVSGYETEEMKKEAETKEQRRKEIKYDDDEQQEENENVEQMSDER